MKSNTDEPNQSQAEKEEPEREESDGDESEDGSRQSAGEGQQSNRRTSTIQKFKFDDEVEEIFVDLIERPDDEQD